MIGFIKYKLFKWLWSDICKTLNCDYCPMSSKRCDNFCCDECKQQVLDCYDVEDLMYKTARRAWGIE